MNRHWWMVAVLLLCAAQASAQETHSDSVREAQLQASLDSMFANPLARLACVMAHENPDSVSFSIDSMVAQVVVSRCEGYRGAVAFVRQPDVDEANVHYLNKLVLKQQPKFWIMCGMRQPGEAICDASEGRE